MERISSPLIAELKLILPESTWSWVIPAIQEDPLVWESLNSNPEIFGAKKLSEIIHTPEDCSPAALALRTLDYPSDPASLRSLPLQPIDENFASQNREIISPDIVSLSQAGLEAFALRQLRITSGSWDDWSTELWSAFPTTLACLYGIIPDQLDLLRAMIPSSVGEGDHQNEQSQQYQKVLHVILSNPAHPDAQTEIINILLEELTPSQCFRLIEYLYRVRPRLANRSTQHISTELVQRTFPEPRSVVEYLSLIENLYNTGKAQHIAAQSSQEISTLINTIKISQQLQSKFGCRLALAAIHSRDQKTALAAWEQVMQHEGDTPSILPMYLFSLIDSGRYEETSSILAQYSHQTKLNQNPYLKFVKTILDGRDKVNQTYSQNPREKIREAGVAALDSLEEELSSDQTTADIYDLLMRASLAYELIKYFNENKLWSSAVRASFLLARMLPKKPISLILLAHSLHLAGSHADATEIAHLIAALDPENLDLRRYLAESLELNGTWEAALLERSRIVDRQENPSAVDLQHLASTAIKAGQPNQAIQICQTLLKNNDQDGLAYTMLGWVAESNGEFEASKTYFNQAVQLTPNHPITWLALAELYQNAGQKTEMLETLQAASQTIPNRPEINLALGEAYRKHNSPTQALAEFRRAIELTREMHQFSIPFSIGEILNLSSDQSLHLPEDFDLEFNQDWRSPDKTANQLSNRITARLGETLLELGHLNDSRQVLEEEYYEFPRNSDLAYAYSRTLIKLNEYELALNPLQTVIDSGANKPGPYLDSARCLIEVLNKKSANGKVGSGKAIGLLDKQNERNLILDKTIGFLHHALELNPQDAEAKTLLGELLYDRGDYEKALELFGDAMDSEIARSEEWKNRLALDLSRVALKLKRGDLALTALLEADHSNLAIQQALSNAYQNMELMEDAFKSAKSCLHLAPDDLENLVWFANFCKELKDHHQTSLPQAQTESINALKKAVDLAPQRGDLWVALGELQMQTQDIVSAMHSFKQIAPHQNHGFIMDCTNSDLYAAGKNLNLLGEPALAAVCLEEALQNKPRTIERQSLGDAAPEPTLLDLLKELASTYHQAGQVEKSLLIYDQALAIEPADTGLSLSKTTLLLDASKQNGQILPDHPYFKQAAESLENAIERSPDQPQLLLYSGILNRACGNLLAAKVKIDRLVQLLQNQPGGESGRDQVTVYAPISIKEAQAYAYELSCAMLQTENAHKYLGDPYTDDKDLTINVESGFAGERPSYPSSLDYACFQAQYALENGNDPLVGEILSKVVDFTIYDPRILALQARLNFHQGDNQAAVSLLNSAMEKTQEYHLAPTAAGGIENSIQILAKNQLETNMQRCIASAAKELSQWEMAQNCLELASITAPQEPQSLLDLIKLFVERAEYQKLCQELEALRHAPGGIAIEQEAYQSFQDTAKALKYLLKNNLQVTNQEAEKALKRWEIRGKAIFEPNPQHVRDFGELDSIPEDLAAKIACLRAVGNSPEAVQVAQSAAPHPLVLIQQAITLEADQPRLALKATQLAAEILTEPGRSSASAEQPGHSIVASSIAPLIFALQARLVHQTGNRNGDAQTARLAIQKALEFWPDEPNWHTLAAKICQKNDPEAGFPDIDAVIAHLKQAIEFDPQNWQNHLALGKVFQNIKNSAQAIQILYQASQLAPQKAEIWHWLAKAYLDDNQLKEAKSSLDRALELAPGESEITLLRGEIAFKEKDYQGAARLAQATLDQKPDDPSGLLLLVRALGGMGKSSEAQALLEKVLPQTVEAIPLFLERARLVQQEKGIEAAVTVLRELIDRFPDHPAAYARLAEFLDDVGDDREAMVVAQQALRVGHNMPSELSFDDHAKMHSLLGKLFRENGQLDQAIQHLTEAIHLAPGFTEPYLELGQTHLDRRQFPEALEVYYQAIAIMPQSPLAYYRAGLILKECKDYVNAEHMLRQAAKLAPEDLAIQRQLGVVVALNLVHNRKQQG